MMLRYLPSVLQQDNGNSISIERALKQIKYLLDHCILDREDEDKCSASIDDVKTMLAAINRD